MKTETMQTQQLPAPPSKSAPPPRRTGRRRWLTPLAVIVAFLIGAGTGMIPTDQSELEGLRADLAEAEGEADELRDTIHDQSVEITELRSAPDEVVADAAEISRLEDRVETLEGLLDDARKEAKESAPPVPGPKRTIVDGLWKVGEEVAPGTYRSGGGGNCYWARLSGFSGDLDDIITNGIGKNQTVTIVASDVGFESSGCGTWTRI
jgi:hypothetical protein